MKPLTLMKAELRGVAIRPKRKTRKLIVFGRFDNYALYVIATHSKKAALIAFGFLPHENRDRRGFALETRDPEAVKAAMARPGRIVKVMDIERFGVVSKQLTEMTA